MLKVGHNSSYEWQTMSKIIKLYQLYRLLYQVEYWSWLFSTVGSGFWPRQSLDLDSVNLNRDPQIYRLETKIGTFLRLCFTAGRILIRWWLYSYFWGILYLLSNHMLVSQVSNYLFFLRCLGIFPWQFASNCWQLCCRLLKRIQYNTQIFDLIGDGGNNDYKVSQETERCDL